MIIHLRLLGVLMAAAICSSPILALPPAGAFDEPEGVIVAFHASAPAAARLDAVRAVRAQVDPIGGSRAIARLEPDAFDVARVGRRAALGMLLTALRRDPRVRLAEPDWPIYAQALPNDPRLKELWGLINTGDGRGVQGADIGAASAWGTTTGDPSVMIAIIDSGIDYNHPDLSANIARNALGGVLGYDFANDDTDPMDDNDHGTHVAGTVGARGNNGVGITGVCQQVRLMPLKVLDRRGAGSIAKGIAAIDYAVANGARVLNLSWGTGRSSDLLLEALARAEAAGVFVVAAAGNEASSNDSLPVYPANYSRSLTNMVTVGSTGRADALSDFSNWGAGSVQIAAPGEEVLSTVRNGGYRYFEGTSMAAPHVTGVVGLLLARYPSLTVRQIKSRLLVGATHLPALDAWIGGGRRLWAPGALALDVTPPGMPVGVRASRRGATALVVEWTASGGDGAEGAASEYEVRISGKPILQDRFEDAPLATAPVTAGMPGTLQRILLSGLQPNKPYYLGVQAVDSAGNVSPPAVAGPYHTLPEAPTVEALRDDVEGAAAFSGTGGWAVTTESSASPSHSYTDSPGGAYLNNQDVELLLVNPIRLDGFAPRLTADIRLATEAGFDVLRIEASADGGASWQALGPDLSGASTWRRYAFDLARHFGSEILLRFRLLTDSAVTGDGVWVDDIVVGGEFLEALPISGGPAAPTDLSAAAESNGSVRLFWRDNSAGASPFEVERRAGDEAFAPVGQVSAGTNGFVDASAPRGASCTYRVRAVGPPASGWSNERSVETVPLPPEQVTGVTAQAGDGEILLNWPAAARASSYTVLRATTEAGPYTALAAGLTTRAHLDQQVLSSVDYFYRIVSVNAGGEGPVSEPVSARAGSVDRPEAPADLRAKGSRGRVKLTWRQSKAGILENRVYRAETVGGEPVLLVTLKPRKRFVDRGVMAGGFYTYYVTAVNEHRVESLPSNLSSGRVR